MSLFSAAADVVNASNKFRGGYYAGKVTYDNSFETKNGLPSDPALIPIQSLLNDGFTWKAVQPTAEALALAADLVDQGNTIKTGVKPYLPMDPRASEVFPVAQLLMSRPEVKSYTVRLPLSFRLSTPAPAPAPTPSVPDEATEIGRGIIAVFGITLARKMAALK